MAAVDDDAVRAAGAVRSLVDHASAVALAGVAVEALQQCKVSASASVSLARPVPVSLDDR